jgi:hypothetical protein
MYTLVSTCVASYNLILINNICGCSIKNSSSTPDDASGSSLSHTILLDGRDVPSASTNSGMQMQPAGDRTCGTLRSFACICDPEMDRAQLYLCDASCMHEKDHERVHHTAPAVALGGQ